ncbi:hypothetical protein MBLNU230_g8444t1 [Neophaeotheca triangularis]
MRNQDALALDFSTPPNVRTLDRDAGQDARRSELVQRAESPQRQPTGLGIHEDQSINFRVWDALNGFARQQDGGCSSPSSKLPSTAVPSVTGDIPPSNLRSAGQHGSTGANRQMGPPLGLPAGFMTRPGADDYIGSATEVATPSVQGTPDPRAFRPMASQTQQLPGTRPTAQSNNARPNLANGEETLTPSHSQPTSLPLPTPAPTLSTHGYPPQEVQNLLNSYAHRLDVLENLSFNQVPVEEIQDKFDFYEARLSELESWHRDCEQREQASPEPVEESSGKKRRRLPTDDLFSGSDGSFDSAAAAHAEAAVLATLAANAETGPRIDALEDRLADLESAAGPSYSHPWQVQVILLPWGRDLRGIWYNSIDATQQSQVHEHEEWVTSEGAPNISFRSTGDEGAVWTTESIEAWASDTLDWLSPKACGPNTTVFQRLVSRGLIRDVSITSSDAEAIFEAISSAFDPFVLGDAACDGDKARSFRGLKQPFIPLRKVRKSSRLRFLSPAEMVTPAIWASGFLDSSVFMKVQEGHRRLYITTPHAYEQQTHIGFTWAQIRGLPVHDAQAQEQAAQTSGKVVEACWTYNEKLDHAPSLHSSFVTRASDGSHWDLESQHGSFDGPPQLFPSSSPAQPQLYRRSSLPSSRSTTHRPSSALPKRRVASFEAGHACSSRQPPTPAAANSKRRRLTTSPDPTSSPRGAFFNLTPRRSRDPPSPLTAESHNPPATNVCGSQGVISIASKTKKQRATTPFAYATPHSNTHFAAAVPGFDFAAGEGEGDTEAGTEIDFGLESEHGEEEWEGVGDDGVLGESECMDVDDRMTGG